MAATLHVHTTHLQFTDGLDMMAVEGNTVGECLNHLIRRFPQMEKALFAKKDKLLNHVEIYVNSASAYPNELGKSIQDGDTIHLLVALSGG
jgi:molybdopterin converting factor small subunit